MQGEPQVYLIRNSQLAERFEPVEQRLGSIVTRTISTLVRAQGIGDLARIYIVAERGGVGFNLARVPAEFVQEPAEPFDPAHMRARYELGESMARRGYPWVREKTN